MNGNTLSFKTKEVKIGKLYRTIILQNENGPCPFLSIVNALILRGDPFFKRFHQKQTKSNLIGNVSSEELSSILGNKLLRINNVEMKTSKENLERNIQDAIEFLPKMLKGLNVNVKFNAVHSFEYTPELCVFDLLRLKIAHCWVSNDPFLQTLSYNSAIEKQIQMEELLFRKQTSNIQNDNRLSTCRLPTGTLGLELDIEGLEDHEELDFSNITPISPSSPSSHLSSLSSSSKRVNNHHKKQQQQQKEEEEGYSKEEQRIIEEGLTIQSFLNETRTQKTSNGMNGLMNYLKTGEVCVLFQNDHFNTLFRYKKHCYRLVTDEGFPKEIVWQKFSLKENEEQFLTGSFKAYKQPKQQQQSFISSFSSSSSSSKTTTTKNNKKNVKDVRKEERKEEIKEVNKVIKEKEKEKEENEKLDSELAQQLFKEELKTMDLEDFEIAKQLQEEYEQQQQRQVKKKMMIPPHSSSSMKTYGGEKNRRRKEIQHKSFFNDQPVKLSEMTEEDIRKRLGERTRQIKTMFKRQELLKQGYSKEEIEEKMKKENEKRRSIEESQRTKNNNNNRIINKSKENNNNEGLKRRTNSGSLKAKNKSYSILGEDDEGGNVNQNKKKTCLVQ